MSSIIRATTTSGLQIAPDNSGSLILQTNGTTAAVTVDTSQNTTFAGKVTSAGALTLASNGTTTALTIDTSQNVGIGTTNPRAPLAFAESAGTAGEPNKIRFYDNGGVVTYGIGISNAQQNYVVAGGGAHCFYVGDLGSATERMRIDSSGYLCLNRTSALGNAYINIDYSSTGQNAIIH
jgi:hypothetical protein